MAGLGFKDFANGNVLTGDEIDGYLMQQSVMRFTNEAARDTALAAVIADGMCAYTAAEDVLWIRRGGSWREMLPRFVTKTADKTVTASTVLSLDNHLFFGGRANAVYNVTVFAITASNASGAGVKFGWNVPAGANFNMTGHGPIIALATSGGGSEWSNLIGSSGSSLPFGVPAASGAGITLNALITLSSTAGTVTLQWAQNAATNNTILKAGSWMRVERVA